MPNDDHFALVIGIDDYDNFDGLSGAVNDAQHFLTWLTSSSGGDVPAGNITTLLTDGVGPDPSFDTVVDEVARYIEDFEAGAGASLGSRLYIYLAGHGINVGDLGDCGLVVRNASLVTSDRNLPGKLLARKFMASGAFDEVVLFMDCCREVIPSNPSGQMQLLGRLPTVPGGNGTVVEGLATKWDRLSREKELPNPNGNGSSIQGLFTHAVLDGLERAVDDTGAVTAERLRDYVREYTLRLGADDQAAEIEFDPSDIVICSPIQPETTVYVTVTPPGTPFDIRDGDFELVPSARAPTPSGAVAVSLVPAKYIFCVPAGNEMGAYTATVSRSVLGREDDVAIE